MKNNSKCSACHGSMSCGAQLAACWCQGFESLQIDPATDACLCEPCLRLRLAEQRALKRQALAPQIEATLSSKTMPRGALGKVQLLAGQISSIQNTLKPSIERTGIMIFAADHGLTDEGVSAFPKSVTWQMVMNFVTGGAAINVLARANHIELAIVDAGVDFDFSALGNGATQAIVDCKVALGTANSLKGAAMSPEQFEQAWSKGQAALTDFVRDKNLQALGFGEMGIGNTSAASLLLSALLRIPIEQLVGRGTGIDDAQLAHKQAILQQVAQRVALSGAMSGAMSGASSAQALAQQCAGFEIVMMAGAMQKACDLGLPIVVDGFIATSAYALAANIDGEVKHYAVFAHQSAEAGHQRVLSALGVAALLDLGLRLGEGSGAALAMPLLRSAASIMREMATFESAAVADRA